MTLTRQFADNGHPKIANELGKLSINIVNTFTEGVEQVPTALYQLDNEVCCIHVCVQF